jgi:maltose O-acetyltransferase
MKFILRLLPTWLKTAVKRIVRFFFFETFDFALRAVPVNTEPWFWIREFMIHMPGKSGLAYRSCFYNHYFKRRGSSVQIQVGVCIEHPYGLDMGDGVGINRNSWLNAVGGLSIGNNCAFGPQTIIHTANHNFGDPDKPFQEQGWTFKPVVIEDDVWFGARVVVLPGARIGKGAVIGAGSIVSGDIAAYAIVHGEKAKMNRSRKSPAGILQGDA